MGDTSHVELGRQRYGFPDLTPGSYEEDCILLSDKDEKKSSPDSKYSPSLGRSKTPSPAFYGHRATPSHMPVQENRLPLKNAKQNKEGRLMPSLHMSMRNLGYYHLRYSKGGSSPPSSCRTLQRSPGRRSQIVGDNFPGCDQQFWDLIKELEDCRKQCEKVGNYLEASAAAKRLQALKLFADNKKQIHIMESHAKEQERAEEAYSTELDRKNKFWDDKFQAFHSEIIGHAQLLKKQHSATLHDFRGKMATKIPRKPQWSCEILNQRKVQGVLGKQGKYLEAQKLKQTTDRMEFSELQSTLTAYQTEVGMKEQVIRGKQKTEMEVLLQRAARTRDELCKNKNNDLQRCHQRHKNIMRDLQALHKQECLKHEQTMARRLNEFRCLGGNVNYLATVLNGLKVLNIPCIMDLNLEDATGSIPVDAE